MKITNEWIRGFVDGDGSFVTEIYKKNLLRHRFIVSQDKKSQDVLYALKTKFSCGSVHKASGNMMNFEIGNREQLAEKCIPFFSKYPLLTKKSLKFNVLHQTLCLVLKKGKDLKLAHSCAELLLKEKNLVLKNNITPGWFRGFVDADGCFYVSIVGNQVQPCFIIGAAACEVELIKRCKAFLDCGTLHTRKNGFETLQVSKIADLETKLIPYFETRGSAVLLRTIKRIAFQKFRKIVRILHEKRHLIPGGMEKVKKLQKDLNKFNKQHLKPYQLMLLEQEKDEILQAVYKETE